MFKRKNVSDSRESRIKGFNKLIKNYVEYFEFHEFIRKKYRLKSGDHFNREDWTKEESERLVVIKVETYITREQYDLDDEADYQAREFAQKRPKQIQKNSRRGKQS